MPWQELHVALSNVSLLPFQVMYFRAYADNLVQRVRDKIGPAKRFAPGAPQVPDAGVNTLRSQKKGSRQLHISSVHLLSRRKDSLKDPIP
jgi:hypothetical protein